MHNGEMFCLKAGEGRYAQLSECILNTSHQIYNYLLERGNRRFPF